MAHAFKIRRNRAGEYVVYFNYNSEVIWWTEGYASKASARNAIESIKRNGPGAPLEAEEEESEHDRLIRQLRNAPVPAADRVVSLDHNSPEYRDFQKAHQDLTQKIKRGNDLGNLSQEDAEVAANEVYQIGLAAEQGAIRPAALFQAARSTLLWLVDKAAGAVVGALAIALLLAVARLVGIAVS